MAIPLGTASKHITRSLGPDVNLNKFYITQYSTTYGKRWEKFLPRTTRHSGTGYKANLRPQIYYCRELDQRDNPTMAAIVANNYYTTTELAFRPYAENTGREPLPRSVYQAGSGFIRDEALNIPACRQVDRPFIDRQVKPQFVDTLPRHVPLLHKIRPKNPVEEENSRYGPGYMTTETGERFLGLPTDHVDTSVKSVGPLTESGFTHNHNIEPVTYHPDFAHRNDQPPWMTNRPIGRSITKTHFLPYGWPNGREDFGEIPRGSERGSGFTKEPPKPTFFRKPADAFDKEKDIPGLCLENIRKRDPMDYLNNVHPHNKSSVYKCLMTGQQRPSKTMPDILDRTDTGNKEDTGFTENNPRFVQISEDPRRFLTETQYRFKHPDSLMHMQAPYVRGGVQDAKTDGFVRCTELHKHTLGSAGNTTDVLHTMEPYQARSIKARDIFHDDHTHDHKLAKSVTTF